MQERLEDSEKAFVMDSITVFLPPLSQAILDIGAYVQEEMKKKKLHPRFWMYRAMGRAMMTSSAAQTEHKLLIQEHMSDIDKVENEITCCRWYRPKSYYKKKPWSSRIQFSTNNIKVEEALVYGFLLKVDGAKTVSMAQVIRHPG